MIAPPTDAFVRAVDAVTGRLLRRWLLVLNLANGLILAGAIVTPLLRAAGWTPLATLLYWAYRPLCPQRPDHSFFIAGQKMAFEQRETAIYLGLVLGGLLFAPCRRALRPLAFRPLALASLPMIVDVLSQTVGLRDSDWRWRTATGVVFALAAIWWAYPRLEHELSAAGTRPPPLTRTVHNPRHHPAGHTPSSLPLDSYLH